MGVSTEVLPKEGNRVPTVGVIDGCIPRHGHYTNIGNQTLGLGRAVGLLTTEQSFQLHFKEEKKVKILTKYLMKFNITRISAFPHVTSILKSKS